MKSTNQLKVAPPSLFLGKMLEKLKVLLLSKPKSQEQLRLRQTLFAFVAFRVMLLSMVLVISAWDVKKHGVNDNNIWQLIALTLAVSVINVLLLKYAKQISLVGHAQFLIDISLATILIALTGSDLSISLYVLVIFAAAVSLGSHGAIIIAACCGIFYALLVSGLLSSTYFVSQNQTLPDIFGIYLTLITVAFVSSRFAKRFESLNLATQKQQQALLQLSTKQKLILDDISDGVMTVDDNNKINNLNSAAIDILELSLTDQEILGKSFQDVVCLLGANLQEEMLYNDAQGEISFKGRLSGEEKSFRYSIRELSDPLGFGAGKVIVINDLTKVRSIEGQLNLHEKMAKLISETHQNKDKLSSPQNSQIIGESPIMQRVSALIEKIARSSASVLITGESGTGKELVARAIHLAGAVHTKPFVALNCGALPENLLESELFGHKKGSFTGAVTDNIGLFRQADGGTIFLDEIGELPLSMQAKLLRVLQDKKVRSVGDTKDVTINTRIIAATNRNLKADIEAGRFREDLYYRLNVVNIIVPPLRERKEDIPLLVSHFIGMHCDQDTALPKVSPEALSVLLNYGYPGNIRELENLIERALVLGGQAILPEHLPDEIRNPQLLSNHSGQNETDIVFLPLNLEELLSEIEKRYLLQALNESGGLKKGAAELLGLNFRSFRYRLKKYGLSDGTSDNPDDNS